MCVCVCVCVCVCEPASMTLLYSTVYKVYTLCIQPPSFPDNQTITHTHTHTHTHSVSSPWEVVSLRVRCADGLWGTEVMNFDPDALKVRGMVLASVGERERERDRGHVM